jgi:hypothetical protein
LVIRSCARPPKIRAQMTRRLNRWLRSTACRHRVSSHPEADVNLSVVRFAAGSGSLGRWGTVRLRGVSDTVIRTPNCEDIDVPPAVAKDRPDGIVLLNDATGRIVFLPYRGEVMASFALAECVELFPPVTLPRDEDPGMRMADYVVIVDGGIVYLNECCMLRLSADFLPVWRVNGDFDGWGFEEVSVHQIVLVALDEREPLGRQVWGLDDGRLIE